MNVTVALFIASAIAIVGTATAANTNTRRRVLNDSRSPAAAGTGSESEMSMSMDLSLSQSMSMDKSMSMSMSSLKLNGGKDSCPVPPTVTCGATYQNGKTITLSQDLICFGTPDTPAPPAITLKGKKTVLDCKGYYITKLGLGLDDQKKGFGVYISEGATLKNCKISGFKYGGYIENGGVIENSKFNNNYVGGFIKNGGMIKNSEFIRNWYGVFISNTANAPATMSMVVNSKIELSAYGGIEIAHENDKGKVLIEDVSSKINFYGFFIYVSATGITFRNVEARENYYGMVFSPSQITDTITLEKKVSLNDNSFYGMWSLSSAVPTVLVTGDLHTDRNGEYGVLIEPDSTYNIELGSRSGSLTACGNNITDIYNNGNGYFKGNDYTCGSEGGSGNLPNCKKKCPDCPSSLSLWTSENVALMQKPSMTMGLLGDVKENLAVSSISRLAGSGALDRLAERGDIEEILALARSGDVDNLKEAWAKLENAGA